MPAPRPVDDLVGEVRHAGVGHVGTIDATAQVDAVMVKESEARVDEHLRLHAVGIIVHLVHSHVIHPQRRDNALGALAVRQDRPLSARLQQRRQIEASHLVYGGVLRVVRPLEPEERITEHEHGWLMVELRSQVFQQALPVVVWRPGDDHLGQANSLLICEHTMRNWHYMYIAVRIASHALR